MQWSSIPGSISFKVSGRWSCDAGRWPVSKVKKNILCVGTVSTHAGSNLTAQVKSRSTSSKQTLFSDSGHTL